MRNTVAAPGDSGPILVDALQHALWTLAPILATYVALALTSGYVVDKTFDYASIDRGDDDKTDTGTAIGKTENVLVLTLMLLEAYTALGVIFAAKSIVRKSDMDTGDTTYYLTGTLSNFTYSVVVGVALHVALWWLIRSSF